MYEQFALFIEPRPGHLARACLALTPSGIDVMYASHVDEALLMIRQEQARMSAVVTDAATPIGDLQELVQRLCAQLPGGIAGLALVGQEPSAPALAALRKQGVQWALFEPYEPRELRFLVVAAQVAGSGTNRRKHLRVPSALEAVVAYGPRRRDARVYDLSAGGAYLATEAKVAIGNPVSLEVSIRDGTLTLEGEVAHVREEAGDEEIGYPRGMGIAFREPAEPALAELRSLLGELFESYRL